MQDIVFYAAANETLGVVRDYANSRNDYAPTLVLGVSVCLRMRLFAGSESAAPFPVDSFSGITGWKWRMDSDFDRETPYKLTADSNSISVQTVTDTIDGETMSFTEFAIPISNMNTLELATWLGTQKKKTGLTGELVGYDSSGNAVFVLQIDDFTVRNRLAGLNEPTSNDQEYLTRSETEQLVQTEISSATAAKQDKLTGANAGAGIAIDSGGTISMSCVILGATNGVKISDSRVQFDPETAIGADGSTRGAIVMVADGLQVSGGTASIDDASVEDVLVGVEGGTASINDQVVTPGNLRGALSVGQAVDVSCAPYNNSGSIVYVNDDFLQGFTATMVNGTTVGFYDTTTHRFPKFADDLVYLFIANVSGSGTVTPNGASAVTLSGTPQRIWTKVTASDSGYISASANATMTVTNWRQYEVTALTDEAIAYIAQLPDPDAFFRSTSAYSIRDKYLIKQDMVCPFISTIKMPDDSDLTVGAGLSYKIRYTNDSPHKITVDTIPADAYGWDAHIQMFIKGTSSIVFQKPLILMDALTPNAGHNLLVKFRNGDAYVYVEDTNAGYIVTEPSGTGAGTLNFGIVDPGTDYVIFAAGLDGTTVDASTAAFVGGSTITTLNILGNGTDATSITGDIGAASGMTINFQDLAISGGTLSGAGTIKTINTVLDNSTFVGTGTKDIQSLTISGTCYTNGLTVNDTLYGTPDSNLLPVADTVGLINLGVAGSRIDGVRVVGATTTRRIFTYTGTIASSDTFYVSNCYFKDCVNTNDYGCYFHWYTGTLVITNTTFSGGTASGSDNGGRIRNGAKLYATDCTWENNLMRGMINSPYTGPTNEVHFAGSNTLTNFHMFGVGDMYTADNTVLDLSKTTKAWGNDEKLFVADSGATVSTFLGNNTTLLTPSGSTASVDACNCNILTAYGKIATGDLSNIVIPAGASNPWKASNVMFTDPIDAGAVYDLKLSGTTFTSASLITGQPDRIQLPAATTVSFSGNTNAADTKILQASVIVVGDNAASPSGSATIINAAGTSKTVSGIGSYIDKEGDNDFTAISNVKSVTVSSGASTVASSLASALALTTSSGGVNRWIKLANKLTATATFATGATVTDKRIITAEYEPVLAGNFSFSGGAVVTVDEATKTTTIASAAMVMSNAEIPSGATVKVSGGGLTVDLVNGTGGTIELAGSNAFQLTGGTIGRVTISSGAIIDLTSSIVPVSGITLYGGTSLSPTMIVCGGSSRIFEDVEVHGTTITDQGIIYGATVYSEVDDDHYIRYTEDNGATSSSVIVAGATVYIVPGGLMQISGT